MVTMKKLTLKLFGLEGGLEINPRSYSSLIAKLEISESCEPWAFKLCDNFV